MEVMAANVSACSLFLVSKVTVQIDFLLSIAVIPKLYSP